MSKKKIRWFQWGDEKPGYVTTWTVGADGSVVIGRIPNGGLNHGIDTVGKNEPGRIG